jgi:hypothetical protein
MGFWKDLLSNASRVDKNVRSTELVDDRVNSLDDGTSITNINPVELNRESTQCMKFGRRFVSQVLVSVKNYDGLGSSLGASPCYIISQSTSTPISNALATFGEIQPCSEGHRDKLGLFMIKTVDSRTDLILKRLLDI